jgi:signal transduction histidine kinase/CheY-like chemotaxis protein
MRGITAISKFQVGTQTLWLLLQVAALLVVVIFEWQQFENWTAYAPEAVPATQAFSWFYFGAAASVFFALIAQIGEQVDYLRFMPEKTHSNKKQWWFWMIFAGPGWVSIGMLKMFLGSFLAFVAIQQGVAAMDAADPTRMYQRAFGYIVHSEKLALILAATMVIISQMKINVTNAYAGSIAWSNFFSRLTHSHPGRVVWLVFNVALALLLMELGIHQVLESILSVFAFVAVSWLCCLSADLLINKPLGLSPKHIEFKRGHLFDINPVGFVSMIVATLSGLFFYLGWFGEQVQTLGHFVTIIVAFVAVPFMAWITKGKYYLARDPELTTKEICECNLCGNEFEAEDILYCPAYQKRICSLCCSLDSRCLDQCKPKMNVVQKLVSWVPSAIQQQVLGRAGKFMAWFVVVNSATAALLSLVHRHMVLQTGQALPLLADGLWSLFFILMIVNGVVIWLFLLAHESRLEAQQESNQQTQKLIREIEAHEVTDAALQGAKELAENANAAKSRYLSGISHELRTPLQSILGYTQLLTERSDTPTTHQQSLDAIHRSGQYLADLIEGLLDVSKIEAGKLDLHVTEVAFPDVVRQIADMFQMQARNKGIEFNLKVHDSLPQWINTDEKRLRQILINLLSNAVKYTDRGRVDLDIRYRSQVAEFTITDTGYGISEDQHQRIFSPFERVQTDAVSRIPGTGLGLTIVKLLVEIMGGDIQLSSEEGKGSTFKVSLMLPWVRSHVEEPAAKDIIMGYEGTRKTLMLVDDDAGVRVMLCDLLAPLGFEVKTAHNGLQCLETYEQFPVDLFIVDASMPGMDGFNLTSQLRMRGVTQPILMLSANAQVPSEGTKAQTGYSDYLIKPIQNRRLLETLGLHLNLRWQTRPHFSVTDFMRDEKEPIVLPDCPEVSELLSASDIGFKRGIVKALDALKAQRCLSDAQYDQLLKHTQSMQFNQIKEDIEVTV